jgi:hypothetical protein
MLILLSVLGAEVGLVVRCMYSLKIVQWIQWQRGLHVILSNQKTSLSLCGK